MVLSAKDIASLIHFSTASNEAWAVRSKTMITAFAPPKYDEVITLTQRTIQNEAIRELLGRSTGTIEQRDEIKGGAEREKKEEGKKGPGATGL